MPFPGPFPLCHAITSLAGQTKGWREALPWHMGWLKDFPHSDVWYEPASMINHTAAFEAYKRQLAEESR